MSRNSKQEKQSLFKLGTYLQDLIDLKQGVNYQETIQEIDSKKKLFGANAWMLMCSIMIASIGLNINSQAVIIGAMLISPLMSPILGIGLGIAINDRDELMESLKHFSISIIIALITSTLFFVISPLDEFTEQIAARTEPTILDAGIGIFGGVAGIISIARKDISTTLPGVAIATALMPPLCVCGFGIANGNPSVAAYSFYLFLLNSFFVAFATYLILRYMDFPLKQYRDEKEKKTNVRIVLVLTLALIIPSLIVFRTVWLDTNLNKDITEIIDEALMENKIYLDDWQLDDDDRGGQILYLKVYGDKIQKENQVAFENALIRKKRKNIKLEFVPTTEIDLSKIREMETELGNLRESSREFDKLVEEVEDQKRLIEDMTKFNSLDSIDLIEVKKELLIVFDDVKDINIGLSKYVRHDSIEEQFPIVGIEWKSKTRQQRATLEKMSEFLVERLDIDTIQLYAN